MDELLNQIASDTGVPADLLERAARARANASGVDVDALVAGWAGGEAPAPAAPPLAPEPTPAADSGAGKLPEALVRRSAAARAKREGRSLDEVLVEMGLSPEGETPAGPAAEPAAAEAPAAPVAAAKEEPAAAEPVAEEEEPLAVFAGFPRWLAASFILIPMIALLYAGLAPNGPNCGTSGQLAINPVNGEAQSCGGDASPFFSLGEAAYETNCVACHSSDGSGGVGPAFIGGAVLQTFSACTDHVEWVTLGTQDWPDTTYGDTGKAVGGVGVMPGYDGTLSPTEIAAVSLYERVAFGGEDIAEAEAACGLVEGAEG
jgi:ribosomal protein L12E/L44/L45/RPP1/RPP2